EHLDCERPDLCAGVKEAPTEAARIYDSEHRKASDLRSRTMFSCAYLQAKKARRTTSPSLNVTLEHSVLEIRHLRKRHDPDARRLQSLADSLGNGDRRRPIAVHTD